MGVINVTPDSFSDGGKYLSIKNATKRAQTLLEEGVNILDIGGESTRPGAKPVDIDDELDRVIPLIQKVRKFSYNSLISVDTYKSKVAHEAIKAGADIINDISGLRFDKLMVQIISEHNVPVVIMHMKGNPENMQDSPYYENIIQEIISFFQHRIKKAKSSGIKDEQIILDPGLGFGKTAEDNFSIIRHLDRICSLGYPVLVGPSRKSFIGSVLSLPTDKRLEGTTAAVSACILNGARMVRVHDVLEIKRVVKIIERVRTAK
tara:strand:- start:75368 stop:76153 length:786 start_codon:yes stop_codon:yes gene_type:complete